MDKVFFRKKAIKRLKKVSKSGKFSKDKRASNSLKSLLKGFKYRSVLLYNPLGIEVDITGILKVLRRYRVKVFVPFMEGKSFKMVSFRIPLNRGKYNIKEPNNSIKKNLNVDIAVVPVIGVDWNFKRVGFGKGMYDRFFPTLKKRPLTIFIQLAKCLSCDVLSQKHDITADFYITPDEIFCNRGKLNDNRVYSNICLNRYRRVCIR